MSQVFDLAVIGGGPGGYIAAIRGAQLGLSVVCIDAAATPSGEAALGGTCTNVGCIPSKALLQSSEHFATAQHGLAEHGVRVASPGLDLERMQGRKATVVRQNNEGIAYLFKKNKVTFVQGRASFRARVAAGWELAVAAAVGGQEVLQARNVVIATGSNPRALPGVPFDEVRVLSNTCLLYTSDAADE